MMVVIDEWLKQRPKSPYDKDDVTSKKKLFKQVKILRDGEKTDKATGEKLASGIGFAEFNNEDLSLYALRYLNNLEL